MQTVQTRNSKLKKYLCFYLFSKLKFQLWINNIYCLGTRWLINCVCAHAVLKLHLNSWITLINTKMKLWKKINEKKKESVSWRSSFGLCWHLNSRLTGNGRTRMEAMAGGVKWMKSRTGLRLARALLRTLSGTTALKTSIELDLREWLTSR